MCMLTGKSVRRDRTVKWDIKIKKAPKSNAIRDMVIRRRRRGTNNDITILESGQGLCTHKFLTLYSSCTVRSGSNVRIYIWIYGTDHRLQVGEREGAIHGRQQLVMVERLQVISLSVGTLTVDRTTYLYCFYA